MAKKFIDIRLVFDEYTDGDYTGHDLEMVKRIGTDLTDQQIDSIAETLGQSDRWNVGAPHAVLAAMESTDPQELRQFS